MNTQKQASANELLHIIEKGITSIPSVWDGKECILDMKSNGSRNWRQMEWMGFYGEYLFDTIMIKNGIQPTGSTYGSTTFDYGLSTGVDVDVKVHSSNSPMMILNDKNAIDSSIANNGCIFFVVFTMDVEYDNDMQSFKKWHDELKGKKSAYVLSNTARKSRKRKKQGAIKYIDIYCFDENNVDMLTIHHQGKNSNGKPRPEKYVLNSKTIQPVSTITF